MDLMHLLSIDISSAMAHHFCVRTTLSIDDELLELVKKYAQDRSLTVGDAVSELIRKAFRARTPTKTVNGLCVFDLPPDSPVISDERLLELEDEED